MPSSGQPTVLFAGGAGTVTGSKHLVRAGDSSILLDCGLFQGLKSLRLRNWEPPPFDPRELDAVVISHAHLDHIGYLPILVRRGYRGQVYCTAATASLAAIVLRDAARLQEEDAERANRRGYTRHHPAVPLFTTEEAERALARLEPRPHGASFPVAAGSRVTFRRAGHILGAATVQLDIERPDPVRICFSGDLGRPGRPILRDPEPVPEADVLLLESTYGDRVHAPDPAEQLVRVIEETAHRGGALIVPAFAIDRAQELLWILSSLEGAGRLPLLSVHLDSPMAIDVTDVYCQHPEEHDLEMQTLIDQERCPLRSRDLHRVRTRDESKALLERTGPMIVIAGSGMATGGRVLHHLARRLPDHRNTVLFTGFQAAGTRGRALLEGARTVRLHGRDIPVRARIERIDGLSAHADQPETLRWLGGFVRPPAMTWLVHGEPEQAQALRQVLRDRLGWPAEVAGDGASVALVAHR
jgi:metallo-beta-lactamase family protein